MQFKPDPTIVVVGLGYVGLPLAIELAEHFRTIGLDIEAKRVAELNRGVDRTKEVDPARLQNTKLIVTADERDGHAADIYIVTVPTPVDASNNPDLGPVLSATRAVGRMIDRGRPAIVIYESTVYPGVTEDCCGRLLEDEAGLVRGRDFQLGYSPERINPGDREHSVNRIIKIVAGENEAVTDVLAHVYGRVTKAGVFRAASIKVAEAAKVIENAQRDINIAFINEVSQIFSKIGISSWDVLEAAQTKWNFLGFQPGLVGGHCIGVDPYYLSHCAQQVGVEPRVILAGRSINDRMGVWCADQIDAAVERRGSALVMGLTFKENIPDLRNSRVIDVVRRLEELGHVVTVHDPLADPAEARREYGVDLKADALEGTYDLVVVTVAHHEYRELADAKLTRLVGINGFLADLKNIFGDRDLGTARRWTL